MKPRSNKRWTKRKHRNGKRPERKGSIKINLTELPGPLDALHLRGASSDMEADHYRKLPPFPHMTNLSDLSNPEWVRSFHQHKYDIRKWDQDMKAIKLIGDMLDRAYCFLLKHQQQVTPAALALDAINKVQPELCGDPYSQDDRTDIAEAWKLHNN